MCAQPSQPLGKLSRELRAPDGPPSEDIGVGENDGDGTGERGVVQGLGDLRGADPVHAGEDGLLQGGEVVGEATDQLGVLGDRHKGLPGRGWW